MSLLSYVNCVKINTGAYAPSPKYPIMDRSNPESIKEANEFFTRDYEYLGHALLWTRVWLVLFILICMALAAALGGIIYLLYAQQIVILQIITV